MIPPKVLARRVSSHPMDAHFWKKSKEIHLIYTYTLQKNVNVYTCYKFLFKVNVV